LRVNVTFRNATTLAGQIILLDQMGLGAATNAPTTFGTPAGVTGNPAGSHFFGPSLSLFGTGSVTTGTVTPTVASGLLSAGYTGATTGSCVLGSCHYGVIFQDLIDGNVTISLSGFSVLFGAISSTSSFSSLQFNLIAPAITVNAGAVPEPPTLLLVLGALLVAAGLAGQRRAAARRRWPPTPTADIRVACRAGAIEGARGMRMPYGPPVVPSKLEGEHLYPRLK
jgi:hypothetical protein